MLCKHESFFLTMRKRKQMRYNEFNFSFFFLNVVMDNCYAMNYGNSFFEKKKQYQTCSGMARTDYIELFFLFSCFG